jgi:predicted dehydrogenase
MIKQKCSIIVGMGIGQLYQQVLEKLGHKVVTVDTNPERGATYTDLSQAIIDNAPFDTAHICTPNNTHLILADELGSCSNMVFVEKPGVANAEEWAALVAHCPYTRFIMVKNNMWRSNIEELKLLASQAKTVNLNWINKDRVPNPGTWFTTKEVAFGGVSRDLMPHLLSLFIALNPEWLSASVNGQSTQIKWKLEDLTTTEYGTVKADGIYDVDDVCRISFGNKWNLKAEWRSMDKDQRNIEFIMPDNSIQTFELGLCPEDAYENMIKDCIDNYNNADFWFDQLRKDLWIHYKVQDL